MTQQQSEKNIPLHVGIIMDGNGRWAQKRNLPRSQGHVEGLKAAKTIVKTAAELGIRYLSLYVFSTENWKRASDEVGFLMGLLQKYLIGEFDFYRENKIRIIHSGDMEGLPPEVVNSLRTVVQDTSLFDGLTVNLAINYGGRNEIVRSVKRLMQQGVLPESVTEDSISQNLDNPDIPDPDLIIRTASELRISNFLLWESAYSEFYFSDKLWPDFNKEDLVLALDNYCSRDRRYGGITHE